MFHTIAEDGSRSGAGRGIFLLLSSFFPPGKRTKPSKKGKVCTIMANEKNKNQNQYQNQQNSSSQQYNDQNGQNNSSKNCGGKNNAKDSTDRR